MRLFTTASVLFLLITLTAGSSFAKSPSLIGSWRGGGIIQPVNGAKERTRCRADIKKAPARGQYRANYRCSSPYGVVSQAVIVKRTSANRYSGSFNNTELKVRGSISIILRGNKQTVTMNSPEGRGLIKMQKH